MRQHSASLDPVFEFSYSFRKFMDRLAVLYTVFQKSDAKTQITITAAYLIRIKYPLSGFNYHLSDVNIANFNKIHGVRGHRCRYQSKAGMRIPVSD